MGKRERRKKKRGGRGKLEMLNAERRTSNAERRTPKDGEKGGTGKREGRRK